MNDEEITKAAWHAYSVSRHECMVDRVADAFRAGMEAGRAEASKRSVMISGADSSGDMAAFLRKLENDPEEAARLLGGAAAARPKRRKGTKIDAVGVDEIVQAGADRQHAEDWMRVRRQHKAPLTRTSWEAMGREAAKAGFTIGQAVQMCAERGWRGFRAEYVARNQQVRHGTARIDRQLETAALMTGAARQATTDMGEIYDVGQQRITSR